VGKHRPGRLALFTWKDAGPVYSDFYDQTRNTEGLFQDAKDWSENFKESLQENQMYVQHHIHKMSPTSGERSIPNACQSFSCKTQCKHGFPKDNEMNSGPPLLVCKGIAKKKHLKVSGARNMLGTVLGQRNSPWLNGTAPGLCVGMSGGNTDIKINDRLPIQEETHEGSACDRQCVPKDPARRARALKRIVRITQTAQAQTNGYFGGYISKKQKLGKLEVRKLVDKMVKLSEKVESKSDFQRGRAVSGRMVTDIEMNSTLRGAAEEVNLCVNLRPNDVLFAECVCTFPTETMDAQQ
jgi:hypothetical protein